MKLLLLGANGYLGARLYVDLKKSFDVIGTYHTHQMYRDLVKLDITNRDEIVSLCNTYKPDIIIHPANYPSAKPAANDPNGYTNVNLTSTEYIKDAADTIRAKLIFISSFAAITANDIYGKLKKQSEDIVKTTKAGYLILRPSLIVGYSPNTTNDRPFNRMLKCLDNKTPGEFDTSWKFQPTYIGHISDVIISALTKNIRNITVHVVCPSIQTQYLVARDILAPFGIDVTPIDKHMDIPIPQINKNELSDLGLPTLRYEEMLQKIHQEISSRNK